MPERVAAVVVGGGILGLATARALHADGRGPVVVLEKEREVAMHQTGRNSGVVHAGLYYAPGSLKARLCRRGAGLLRAFCSEHGIPYEACGKLVVATRRRELERLERLAERAAANEVPGLRTVAADELAEIEPHVTGLAGLHSPETAIVDFAAVARRLAEEVAAAGGAVRTGRLVERVGERDGSALVELADGSALAADRVVVCAGLHADRLARASGQPAEPRIVPFRGEYWRLRAGREELVRGLVYPVPDPALPFLGVHLTRKVDGSVWVGPNAVMATALEGYSPRALSLRDTRDVLAWPGTRRLVARYWRAGLGEVARASSRRLFVAEARRYVPELRVRDVVRAPAGVRAQAVDRDGSLVDDFRIGASGRRVAWVRNAPSPGATSALAIAETLVDGLPRA